MTIKKKALKRSLQIEVVIEHRVLVTIPLTGTIKQYIDNENYGKVEYEEVEGLLYEKVYNLFPLPQDTKARKYMSIGHRIVDWWEED